MIEVIQKPSELGRAALPFREPELPHGSPHLHELDEGGGIVFVHAPGSGLLRQGTEPFGAGLEAGKRELHGRDPRVGVVETHGVTLP